MTGSNSKSPRHSFGRAKVTEGRPVGEALREKGVGGEKPKAGHWTQHFKGRLGPRRSGMNSTEKGYADHLDELKAAGEIVWWRFEPFTLRVTAAAEEGGKQAIRMTPDFAVMMADGTLVCDEVKGYAGETGMLRLKAAAEAFPFVFRLVTKRRKKDGGGYQVERL